jgi:methyl-accepting chemotaxis protein
MDKTVSGRFVGMGILLAFVTVLLFILLMVPGLRQMADIRQSASEHTMSIADEAQESAEQLAELKRLTAEIIAEPSIPSSTADEINQLTESIETGITDIKNISQLMINPYYPEYYMRLFNTTILLAVSCLLLIVVEFIFLYFYDRRRLVRRINRAADIAAAAAAGTFESVVSDHDKNNHPWMAFEKAIMEWYEISRRFTGEIKTAAERQANGGQNTAADEKAFAGIYQEALRKLNQSYREHNENILTWSDWMKTLTNGNFNVDMPRVSDSKNGRIILESAEALRQQLKTVNNALQTVPLAVTEGRLSHRADISAFTGEWARTAQTLNVMTDTLSFIFSDLQSVGTRMTRGDYAPLNSEKYKGDFNQLKSILNESMKKTAEILNYTAQTLTELSGDKNDALPTVTREYPGIFAPIKNGLNQTINWVNRLNKEKKVSAAPPSLKAAPPAAAHKHYAPVKPTLPGGDSLTPARPQLQKQSLQAPSAAHIYDTPGYGKYSF